MNFYCIVQDLSANPTIVGLLKAACKKQGLNFVLISSQDFDFNQPMTIPKGSILHRVSSDRKSKLVFKVLFSENVATIYNDPATALRWGGDGKVNSLIHLKNNLSIIPTIFNLSDDKIRLADAAKRLGGYPIIIKAVGGSHGVGVMKIDSQESLFSVADYLISKQRADDEQYIMRRYIDYATHARITVIDGKVIDSIEYTRVPGDFRSNAGDLINVKPHKFSAPVQKLATEAVKVLGVEFGGVDILIDKQGKAYIAEVNVPCYFPRSQQITGTDIAGKLVAHLKNKAVKAK